MADRIIPFAVKGIASAIGLASESITAHKNKKRAKSQTREADSKSPAESGRSPSDEKSRPFEEKDENQWALDDAQEELLPAYSPATTPDATEKPIRDVKILIDIFIQAHPLPNFNDLPPAPRLPFPVVLPQRRPETRSRGFIRAYAPVLMNTGIDQATFLDYLELFDKASQASPWLNAINLAGFAFSFLPAGISMAISVAIAISVKVAMEMQSRTRTNTFLDRLNEEFFRPRGLFCLVLTWNPESADTHHNVNLTSTLTSATTTPSSGTQRLRHKFQSSSGNTYGELEFPETAPLIFPVLEHLESQDDKQALKLREKLIKKHQFIDSYWDKRAQARYAAKNPDSMLAQGPKPEFTSRYADPNHPASSGNLISLITGGHINPPSRKDMMMQQRQGFGGFGGGFGGGYGRTDAFAARREMMGGGNGGYGGRAGMMGDPYGGRFQMTGYDQYQRGQVVSAVSPRRSMDDREYEQSATTESRQSVDGRERSQYLDRNHNAYGRQQMNAAYASYGGGFGGLGGFNAPDLLKKGVKKVLGKNVLYMMVVNMPSEEEMVIANKHANAAEKEAERQM